MASKTTLGPWLWVTSGMNYYWDSIQKMWVIGGTPVTTQSTFRAWDIYEVKTDNPVPRRKKPVGLDLLKAVNLTNWSWMKTTRIYGMKYYGYGNSSVIQEGVSQPLAYNATRTKAVNLSLTRLRVKIKNEDWNLSVFLGELPETMKWFAQIGKGVVKSYQAVKHGDIKALHNMVFPRWNKPSTSTQQRIEAFRNLRGRGESSFRWDEFQEISTLARKASWQKGSYRGGAAINLFKKVDAPKGNRGSSLLDTSGNKWMEWRYAISPMMYDLEDAMKYLMGSSLRVLVNTAEGSSGYLYERVKYVQLGGFILEESRVKINTGAYYQVNPDVSAFQRLGALNPLVTLYELTPLSFVFDWLIPIGTYLGGLDAMAGVTVIGSYQTEKSHQRMESHVHTYPYPVPYGERITENSWTRKVYGRAANPSLDNPPIQFGVGLNAKRFIDSLVLLRQFAK